MNHPLLRPAICLAIFIGAVTTMGFSQETLPLPEPTPIVQESKFPELPAAAEGMGAEAWYFEAKKLEQSAKEEKPDVASLEFLYRLAFAFGEKTAAKEAGKSLIALYQVNARNAEAAASAKEWLNEFGPDWDVYKSLIVISLASENPQGILEQVGAVRKNMASTAKTKANELSYYEYFAKSALGDTTWIPEALLFLRSYSIDAWGAKILRLAATAPSSSLDSTSKELALLRADYFDKNYNQAALHAVNAQESLHAPKTARQLISEAGRSFMNSADLTNGIPFFESYFPGMTGRDPDGIHATLAAAKWEERLWVAAFYLARLWQAAGYEKDAGILFLALSDEAPTAGDADGALWYWLDITMRRITSNDFEGLETLPVNGNTLGAASGAARSLEFAAYVEASTHWKNAASFDDLVDAFARKLLREKSWDDAVSLSLLIGKRVSKSMGTRLKYLSARLTEENFAKTYLPSEESYKAILADAEAEEYYRTMSAWRLRQSPAYLAAIPNLSDATQASQAPSESVAANGTANGTKASLDLIGDYLAYDLGNLAASVAVGFVGNPDKNLVTSLAFQLSRQGEHNAALRLARDAINKGMGSQYPELYGLMYPKAWPGLVEEAARIPDIPPALAYGIIRSESVFDPRAVSYAGAVGLSQVMPATAKETASGLKMTSYSLTEPADNLKIGMTYYSYMMARFGRRPMRAMFAYNAGPGRMMAWDKESGELPDDILLEALHLSQPRQYAKNIIQAALAYGKIHYSIEPAVLLDYLVLGKPLPVRPLALPTVAAEPAIVEPIMTAPEPEAIEIPHGISEE